MNKREIGTRYEEVAFAFLKEQGHELICQNYRIRTGEIDLITRDGRYLVFCEVKYRKDLKKGYGYEAVDKKKQKVLIRTAQHFLLTHGYDGEPCRFDVISILDDEITYIKNAFEV